MSTADLPPAVQAEIQSILSQYDGELSVQVVDGRWVYVDIDGTCVETRRVYQYD